MKITLVEVLTARDSLSKLEKLPGKVAYKLGVLMADLGDQVEIMNDVRNDLIKKYGTMNEKGQPEIKNGTPEMDLFTKEYSEVLNQEIEIKFDEPVKIPGDSLSIQPVVLMNLRKFIEVV